MTESRPSAFGRFVEWLGGKFVVIGTSCVTAALLSSYLGFGHSVLLYVSAGIMFLISQLFIVRWMFGAGMRSIKDLGFGSNRQALKYGLFMKGVDWRIFAVALYGLIASLILGFLEIGRVVSGSMLLAFATFGAATQAIRLNRFWPADASS